MKIILTVFIIFYLLTKPTIKPQWECNISTIFQAIPPIVWYEQTIGGEYQQPLVTRFLHNKINIFMSQFTKCYARSLEPTEVYLAIGIIGLFFWANFIYEILTRKNWLLMTTFLTVSAVPIFISDLRIIGYSYKIFAMIGFAYFLKKIK